MAQCGLNGTVWIFSGTICVWTVDPWGDESSDLVEITRVKFMEAQGARDWPPAIQSRESLRRFC